MSSRASEINSAVWQKLYSQGRNDLRYPSDVLVRLGAWLFGSNKKQRILDFGFGTGANLLHFASQGFEMHGVEISTHALARAQERLHGAQLQATLELVTPGQRLPYEDAFFDVTYAWQMLYYNNLAGWRSALAELERVTKPGGRLLIATAAPGDVSQVQAEPLGDNLYRSTVAGQEGCIVLIPDRSGLDGLFPGREIEVGEFGYRFGEMSARYWIVTYRMPAS